MRRPCSGFLLLLACFLLTARCQEPPSVQRPADPTLRRRPPAPAPAKPSVIAGEGRLRLDVVVTEEAGKPVIGLQPWDFKVIDNGQERKILTFQASDGATVKPDPLVEAILVLDTVNLPFQQVSFVRTQSEQFLRRDGGRFKQPVLLILLTDTGIRLQQRATTDGNAVADLIKGVKGRVSSLSPAMGSDGLVERFQLSVHQLASIAENQALRPGRKLLIWVGPGRPMLDRPTDGYSEIAQRRNFDGIVELATKLREARMALYSVSPVNDGDPYTVSYQNFLKPVRTWQQAEPGDLALKVLVTQTGGLVLGPSNDLAGQIERCMADANAFYRISFNPPPGGQAGEYHELRVQVDQARMRWCARAWATTASLRSWIVI